MGPGPLCPAEQRDAGQEMGFIAVLCVTILAGHFSFLAFAFSDMGSVQQCCHLIVEKPQGVARADDCGHGEYVVAK